MAKKNLMPIPTGRKKTAGTEFLKRLPATEGEEWDLQNRIRRMRPNRMKEQIGIARVALKKGSVASEIKSSIAKGMVNNNHKITTSANYWQFLFPDNF